MATVQSLKKKLQTIRSTAKVTRAMKTASTVKYSKLSGIYAEYQKYADEYFLYIGIYAKYEDKYLSAAAEVDLTSVGKVANEKVSIRVIDRVLHVVAEENMPIEVYALDAQHIVSAQGRVDVELPRGVYIVKVGGEVRKVVVK